MSDSLIEITCPRCGHKWYVSVSELEKAEQVFYREVKASAKVTSYRVRCPKDGTYVIVDVEEVDDD